MKFEGFYGNSRIKEYLGNAINRGEVSHAFLLSGPSGIGKKTLAGILAQALVCQGSGERPCGVCPACVKSGRNAHPDIIHIRKSEASIKVSEIRALKQDAYLRPNDGAKKVYLIHEADSMTQEAQDALLKILEEPPAFTVFLLLCYNEKSMLETVRSRCVRLPLAPLGDEDMHTLIKDKFPDSTQDKIMALVARACGIAGSVLSDAEENPAEQSARRIADAICSGDALAIAEEMISVEKLKRDELSAVLDCISVYLRDALVVQSGGTAFYGAPVAQALFSSAGAAGIVSISDAIARGKTYLRQNIGVAHVAGVLACEFAKAVRK